MNKTYFCKGIILKRTPFRERDSRVLLYTDSSGFLDLHVRGTNSLKSKLAGHVEPFNALDLMVIKGKQWDYLGAASSQNVFANLKSDPEKVNYAGALFRTLIQILKPGISDSFIYNLILEYLVLINREDIKASPNYLSQIALLKFLSHFGFQPMLEACVLCGKKEFKEKVLFNPEKSGIVCPTCHDPSYSFAVDINTIKQLKRNIINTLTELAKNNIDKKTEEESVKVISSFYKYNF